MTALTPEQQDAFDKVPADRLVSPSGGQTLQQARNFAIDSFRAFCQLEGIDVPSEEAVAAAIDAASA